MSWRVAKSLLHLRDQVNRLFPNRDRSNDGTIGDAAHASRSSDHNPWVDGGVVTAMDISHDPKHGFDSYKFAEELRLSKDSRIKYVISNRRIFSTQTTPWTWRAYNGSNPHDHHVHISVLPTRARYDDERDWVTPLLGKTLPTPVQPNLSTQLFEHVIATEFGGTHDPNTSAYDNHHITDVEFGVALPFKFTSDRPKVRVHGPKGSAVGSIVDVGPWNTNDPYWKKKDGRPQAETGTDMSGRKSNRAGIDLTPALARAVGISGKGLVNWEFVSDAAPVTVKKEVTTPQAVVATAVVASLAPIAAAPHLVWPWVIGGIFFTAAIVYGIYKYVRKS